MRAYPPGDNPDLRSWEAWHRLHQPFELDWWHQRLAKHSHCDDPGFTAFWNEIKGFIRPEGVILDIGCGPRPPFTPCAVIEPLADEYKKLVDPEWWRWVESYNAPAENQIPILYGRFDTIICWNCLDHTIGWCDILDNMLAYGNKTAHFAVATDFFGPFLGHPGFEREIFDIEIAKRFKIIDKREPFHRQLALLLKRK